MKSLWSKKDARGLDDLGLLVYASRLLGQDTRLVVWGGGNSSMKGKSTDPRGRTVETLWVKGSGSDMKSCEEQHFPPMNLEDLMAGLQRDGMTDEEMVDYFSFAKLDAAAPRPSIETLLHAFVPHKYVLHTHADAILSLTNNENGEEACRECYGEEAIWIPYIKPGFTLAKIAMRELQRRPGARALVLENHGLITFDDDAHKAYEETIRFVTLAEKYAAGKQPPKTSRLKLSLTGTKRRELYASLAPALRGALSRDQRAVLRLDEGADVLKFLENTWAEQAARQGPATPDHMLRTKRLPLFVKRPSLRSPEKLRDEILGEIEQYRVSYEAYWKRNHKPNDPMLGPFPKIILVPGIGMITTGKTAREADIVAEIYHHTIAVMTAANRIAPYQSLPEDRAYEMEYWSLELYKLSMAPPEKEFSRRITLITGAGSGIGRACALRFAAEGAHVVLGDIDQKSVEKAAGEINDSIGTCRAFGVAMDVGSEKSVRKAFDAARTEFGGLDILISNAGTAFSAPVDEMDLKDWENSLRVNATGHFLVAREALKLMKEQRLGGSIIFNCSKNVLVPGKDFAAYSAAKSAETQLAKIVAIEGAPHGIRANILHPDAIFQDSKLWSKEVRAMRARAQGIAPREIEDYYRERNLLKVKVEGKDVAEAALFFASDRSSKTTGCSITIDGGLREAFPR